MEKGIITSLIVSSSSLVAAALSTFYAYRLNKKLKDIEVSRVSSALLNGRLEMLKEITRSLSRIDKVIMSSKPERQKHKTEIIDKTSQAYLSTKEVFDQNYIFLPEPVTESLVREKDAIDELIIYVKDNLTGEATGKGAFDEALLELLRREAEWVDSVEKNFKRQLEVCVVKVNSMMN